MTTLALILAMGIGCLLAVLGSGGSILALPILVYVAGIPVAEAVPMSLVVVGASALAGALLRRVTAPIHVRAALLFSAAGLPGAWLGSRFTHLLPGPVVMMVFAAILTASAVALLRRKAEREPGESCDVFRCLGVGAILGVLTGFLGVGGGFLIFPALVLFAGIAPQASVSTSLVIIGANSASGLISHLGETSLDWRLTSAFVFCSLVGMAIGVRVGRNVEPESLRKAFACFVLATAVVILSASVVGILRTQPPIADVEPSQSALERGAQGEECPPLQDLWRCQGAG